MPIANTSYNCVLKDNPSLNPRCSPGCGQVPNLGTRKVTLYVPSSYNDGDEAAVMVSQDGSGGTGLMIKNVMDNLIGNSDPARSLPTFLWVSVQVAGPGSVLEGGPCGDGVGSERNNEYATVSDKYARFISEEVFPFVVNHPDVKSAYPNLRITSDPAGRASYGCSKGGAAAVAMAFLRPDLFGIAIGYSAGFYFKDETLTSNITHPLGMAEFWVPAPEGQELIKTESLKPIRVFHSGNEKDFGTNGSCYVVGNKTFDFPYLNGTYQNFLEANNKVQDSLEEKGYTATRYAYGRGACHCQLDMLQEDLPNTLVWAWSHWHSLQILQNPESAANPGARLRR